MQGFEQLRERFIRNSMRRLDDMEADLDRATTDDAAVDALRRNFHGLAGLGTTYGFPRVSELGRDGERVLGSATAHAPLDEAVHTELRRLIAAMRAAYSADGAADVDAAAPAEEATTVQSDSRTEVLLVDGDEELDPTLGTALREEGFDVRHVQSRSAASAQLRERLPAAIIVSTSVSDGSCYSVIEEVRRLEGGDDVAAFIVSNTNAFPDKVEAVRCGADGFFEKPLNVEQAVRVLRTRIINRSDEPKRILSVEDEDDQAEFIRMILESAGYVVRLCRDPRSFDADLTSFRPDLVIMDILLPGISGFELARYVRQNETYATLPIIFLSTEGQLSRRIESIRAGGDDHLVKPVTPPLLLSTVAARIERARFLQTLVDRDGLTGLLTHTAFLERAKQRFGLRSRTERAAALVMLDIDRFKRINDTYGHPTGDRVLATLASFLRRRLRLADTVGRYGGEEFAILVDDLNGEEALRLVSRLLEEFGAVEHKSVDGRSFTVTFSAGIAMLDAQTTSLEEWKEHADQALYRAKQEGRNRVVLDEDEKLKVES